MEQMTSDSSLGTLSSQTLRLHGTALTVGVEVKKRSFLFSKDPGVTKKPNPEYRT